ncbi:MAG: metal ABC transporter substrate-binding protein [Chloroflexota bacterium]|nr:metal ABC transporter substrate-binding protein [Chloroflexota bacterium]
MPRGTMVATRRLIVTFAIVVAMLLTAACGSDEDEGDTGANAGDAGTAVSGSSSELQVIATTTIIADMARQVAGDRAEVTSLLPVNADPHDFEPTPRDVEAVADADLVLEHGLGLDGWAEGLVDESGTGAPVVTVTDGIDLLEGGHAHAEDDEHAHEHDAEGTPEDDHADEHHDDEEDSDHAEDEHGHDDHAEGMDPHVWFDVTRAKVMVDNIRDALIEVDPEGRETYEANASAYQAELDELHTWIQEQIATIPEENRKIVTTHENLNYYVEAYGLELVGTVIPSLDTQAQPSAGETAALIDAIREQNVQAIFVEAALNPDLAEQIASEAGVEVVDNLYGDALGPDGSGAETYIGLMRTDTELIVEALK